MTIKKKWRREFLPAEKRVDFKRLEEDWSSVESELVDELIPVMTQVIERLERDLRNILDSEKYGELKELKVGYKDKLVRIFKTHMFDAFKFGKESVYSEFKIQREYVLNTFAREIMSVKAETIVNDILDKIKAKAIFTALDGIKAGHTADQIIADVKGPAFTQQRAEPATV